MKIAISSTGKSLESRAAKVFGRCPYFVIAEIRDKTIKKTEVIENIGAGQMGGAGITAAQLVSEKNVSAVVSGEIGPRAFAVLKQFNIEVYSGNGKVKEVIQDFIDNKLKKNKC